MIARAARLGLVFAVAALAALFGAARRAEAQDAPINARVVYKTGDGLYVDVGVERGLKEGAVGWLQSGTQRIGRFKIAKVGKGSSFLTLEGGAPPPAALAAGAQLALVLDAPPKPAAPPPAPKPGAAPAAGAAAGAAAGTAAGTPPKPAPPPKPAAPASPYGERKPSPTLKPEPGADPKRPLLAPADLGDQAFTEAANIFHGEITARQAFQLGTADGDLNYALTRVRTLGSLERIDASSWTLEWNAELSYRGGEGLERTRDDGHVRPEVFRLALFRRFDDRSFIRLGRFVPRELPGVGYLDGFHGEYALDQKARFGTMVGFAPSIDRLAPSADAPTGVLYSTVNVGEPGKLAFYGTFGVLGSLYEGDADRLAVLADMRLDAGAFGLYSSTEVDFDVDNDDTREGTRLTRGNLLGTWDATKVIRLSAGVDRFEVPDTGQERDVFNPGGLDADELWQDDGYWRFYGGASLRVAPRVTIDGEISYTADDQQADAWRGSLSLTVPLAERGSLTIAAYNLAGPEMVGYGGRVSAYLPFYGDRLSFQPALSVRYTESDTTGDRFFNRISEDILTADAGFRVYYILSARWTIFGGADYASIFGDEDDQRVLIDVGVTWRW